MADIGPVSSHNRVLTGHSVTGYVRLLGPLILLTHSAALRFAMLAPFTGLSFLVGWLSSFVRAFNAVNGKKMGRH